MPPAARRVLPWLAVWVGVQVVLRTAGWLAARRLDEGDEGSAVIRRVVVMNGVELTPRHLGLSSVRVDAVMGGGVVDLTGLPRVPGGIDLRLRAVMGGLSVRVPADWRVSWTASGPGGVGVARGSQVTRIEDERAADLRIRAAVVFGGIGIEAPKG